MELIELDDFYKYIYLSNGRYYVIKNHETYFSSKVLAEALYERDLLIECEWDIDLYVNIIDKPNPYLNMELPVFCHTPRYIKHDQVECWNVYKWRNKIGSFDNQEDAITFAVENGGRVKHIKDRFFVQRNIKGKYHHFGTFHKLKDAVDFRDKLMENNWKI